MIELGANRYGKARHPARPGRTAARRRTGCAT